MIFFVDAETGRAYKVRTMSEPQEIKVRLQLLSDVCDALGTLLPLVPEVAASVGRETLAQVRQTLHAARINGQRWHRYPHDPDEDSPGVFICDCGHLIEDLIPHGRDFDCPVCRAEFNSSGQRLAPREQWGEETGEHPADIARAFGSTVGDFPWRKPVNRAEIPGKPGRWLVTLECGHVVDSSHSDDESVPCLICGRQPLSPDLAEAVARIALDVSPGIAAMAVQALANGRAVRMLRCDRLATLPNAMHHPDAPFSSRCVCGGHLERIN